MDPHLNIFNNYSQGSFDSLNDLDLLENNVTKYLIVTLKYCTDSNDISNKFVEFITGVKCHSTSFDFDLQTLKDPNILSILKRKHPSGYYFLGISPYGDEHSIKEMPEGVKNVLIKIKKEKKKVELLFKILDEFYKSSDDVFDNIKFSDRLMISSELGFKKNDFKDWSINKESLFYMYGLCKGSRPDAWISNGDNIVLLIENKIYGKLSPIQNERHIIEHFTNFNKNKNYLIKSWKDIYSFFYKINKDYKNNNLLINHFIKYLELIGMGPVKFTSEDFEAFYNPDQENTDILRKAHMKLYRLAKDEIEANKSLSIHLGKYSLLKRDFSNNYLGLELNLNPELKYSKSIHYSISLTNKGLDIYVVIEPKHLIKKLIDKWRENNNEIESGFNNILWDLPTIEGYIQPCLEINEKWFFIRGFQNYYRSVLLPIDREINIANMVFSKISNIINENNRKKIISNVYKDKNYRARSISSTLNVKYSINSIHAVSKKDKIKDIIIQAIIDLKPIYEYLNSIVK